jgi:formate hydrogenlyase subunit 4
VIATALQVAAFLALSPLLLGIVNRTKALAAGRQGPPLLQPYHDLRKLAGKELVLSAVTSWIFAAAPAVVVAATLLAGLMIPLGSFDAPLSFAGDFVLFAYLLALARFFTAAAALDTGSPFEGMGAAREVGFAWLTEPALFLAFLVLSRLSGSLSFDRMLDATEGGAWVQRTAPLVLTAAGLFIVLLAECSRIPVDDPNTHLELTMIHEVMVLDHSGPLLGLIEYASSLKLFVLAAMLLHVVAPTTSVAGWPGFVLFLGGLVGVALVVGVVESTMARLRLLHVPTLLIAAVLACGFAFLLLNR